MKKYITVCLAAAMILLTGCNKEETPEETTAAVQSEASGGAAAEFEEDSDETTSEPEEEFGSAVVETPDDPYIIYWEEGGQEKSEALTGYVTPDIIITEVLQKYYDVESVDIYAADWVIADYYEDEETEAGLIRTTHYIGVLDISEGYSAFVGSEDLEKVTRSIARSFIDTYGLESIMVSEMREDILSLEK